MGLKTLHFIASLAIAAGLVFASAATAQDSPRENPPKDEPPPRRFDPYGGPNQPPRRDDRPPADGQPPRAGQPNAPIGLPGPPHRGPFRGPVGPMGPGSNFDRELDHLREHDPEMYELEKADRDLEKQTFDLAQAIRQAPADKREALKADLGKLVQAHFDVRQQRRKLQLKRLEEELQRLRESIEGREQESDQIIDRRIGELIGEEDDLSF